MDSAGGLRYRVHVENLILIAVCLAAGLIMRRTRVLPESSAKTLNHLIIYLSLPAMVIHYIHELAHEGDVGWDMWMPVAMPWIFYIAAAVFFGVIAKLRRWSRALYGCLLLTAGFGNTSFVGFPLLEAFYGPEALKAGILIDQVGSFLLLSSLGMVTAALASGKAFEWKATLKKVFLFPSTIAFAIALATAAWVYPPWLASAIEKVSATLIPMALISVGLQLHFDRKALSREGKSLSLGLLYKLVVGPALMMFLFVICLGMRGLDVKVTVVEASMAPMITSAIIAADNGLIPELSSLMIGLGIPISFLTVPLWYWLLEKIA